ncbi:hypothetical protein GLOIN_2v1780643 [Rhizophagus clarus]|uniref:Uncharacterized protein n=1 Tax=Rhizophagus clarus TaxID=94130 RepID=A0A8H3QXV4_9GLOM|nr:hypothetical protein GLOIN_2v1780643 [Rhizophagus clarus]
MNISSPCSKFTSSPDNILTSTNSNKGPISPSKLSLKIYRPSKLYNFQQRPASPQISKKNSRQVLQETAAAIDGQAACIITSCTPERREHEHCKNAAHRVFSNERWRCAHHSKFIHTPQKSAYIVKNDPQYKKQADNIADNQIDKRVHSTRLGISYDVTIRKFKQFDKKTQDQLRGEGKYFKLYKNLQFDIKRSKEQIKQDSPASTRPQSHNNAIVKNKDIGVSYTFSNRYSVLDCDDIFMVRSTNRNFNVQEQSPAISRLSRLNPNNNLPSQVSSASTSRVRARAANTKSPS